MAHEVLLEPRLLLLLSSPISLEYGDRTFVDSRRVFRLSHARKGKVVCARRQESWGIMAARVYMQTKSHLSVFLNVSWWQLILRLHHWMEEEEFQQDGRGGGFC